MGAAAALVPARQRPEELADGEATVIICRKLGRHRLEQAAAQLVAALAQLHCDDAHGVTD